MPVFNYQARTRQGEMQTGRVEASSVQVATEILQRNNLFPIALESTEKMPFYARRVHFLEHVGAKDLVITSRQLSALFAVGVPLVSALRTVATQTESATLRDIVGEIAADVDGGMPFSGALARHPNIFSNFYTQMVRAGEASGRLDEILEYLADNQERQYELERKIKGAMLYPALVFATFSMVATVMLIFVVPQITAILTESGQKLPIFTQLILWISIFIRRFWLLTLITIIGAFLAANRYIQTREGRELWDRIFLKVPVLGSVLKKIFMFRFAESLSTLIQGGIPISQALSLSADIVGNATYRNIILEARKNVRRGDTLASTLRLYPEIPPMVTQMIVVGEETGKLDTILKNVAGFYQKDVANTLDDVSSLIEPLLIIFMGLAVGFLVVGVLLPIYNLTLTL